jgi:hypothetical protein
MSDHVVERIRHGVNHGPSANRSRQCCLADGLEALAGTPRRATLRAYPRVSLCTDPAFARNVAAMVDAASGARLADQDRARAATARVGAIVRPRAEGYRHHALRDRIPIATISVALRPRAASAPPDHASSTLRRPIVKKTYDIIVHTTDSGDCLIRTAVPMLDGAAMRAILLTALATVGALSSGMAVRQADAAMPFSSQPSTVAAQVQTIVQTIANVCGTNGCARVQTQRVVKQQKAGNVVPNRH